MSDQSPAHTPSLDSVDADQLRELLNIGVSHASTKLSQFTNHRITISVPTVGLQSVVHPHDYLPNPEEVSGAILLRFNGALEGFMLLIFTEIAVRHLLESLGGTPVGDIRTLDDYQRSALQEVGNIVAGGMLGGIGPLLSGKAVQSVPDVVIDSGASLINSIVAGLVHAHGHYVAIDVSICVDAREDVVACEGGDPALGRLFLFLGPDAADAALGFTRAYLDHAKSPRV
ncbi:MAG TPA: chemotaxis protein CheC [Candidatus Paceibacterota bacterium]|nr:chemotaxis protein CheC [Candidatus Paceibacterota bacterium]